MGIFKWAQHQPGYASVYFLTECVCTLWAVNGTLANPNQA